MTRHHDCPAEIRSKIEELSSLARDARKASGLTVDQVAAATHNDRSLLTRINTGSWVDQGLSTYALTAALKAMDASSDVIDQAIVLYDEIVEWRKASRRDLRGTVPHARGLGLRIVRWGCAASQPPTRPYASLDRLSLEADERGRVTGTIERIEPEARRGASWICAGILSAGALHLTFWPAEPKSDGTPQSDSVGHIAVHRQPSRTRSWPGFFTKLERGDGRSPHLNSFSYVLAPPDPRVLLPAVSAIALIDFDNTLASGWIMDSWLEVLGRQGVGRAGDGFEQLQRLFAEYAHSNSFGHDHLASEAAQIYAKSLSGVAVDEVTQHAPAFVANYLSERRGRLFASSRALLDGLRERGLRPVLVTGAPKEVVDRLMRELDISTAFPLLLERENDHFTGRIHFNHGLASAKAEACELLEERECDILVAIGDSEGDLPMWKRARCAIRIDGTAAQTGLTLSGVDLHSPLGVDFWEHMPRATWLNEVGP
jgi:phosphoserine phosphatase